MRENDASWETYIGAHHALLDIFDYEDEDDIDYELESRLAIGRDLVLVGDVQEGAELEGLRRDISSTRTRIT